MLIYYRKYNNSPYSASISLNTLAFTSFVFLPFFWTILVPCIKWSIYMDMLFAVQLLTVDVEAFYHFPNRNRSISYMYTFIPLTLVCSLTFLHQFTVFTWIFLIFNYFHRNICRMSLRRLSQKKTKDEKIIRILKWKFAEIWFFLLYGRKMIDQALERASQ